MGLTIIPLEVRTRVLAILNRYFLALEADGARYIVPDPQYRWTYYKRGGEVTIGRFRSVLDSLDTYLNANGQHNWAEANYGNKQGTNQTLPHVFQSGPGLSRLPDAALLCLFQELDSIMEAWFGPNTYKVT